jgi:hypothetical protein
MLNSQGEKKTCHFQSELSKKASTARNFSYVPFNIAKGKENFRHKLSTFSRAQEN